mmetsp:Transcript_3884/g.9189  ORF Transcript_3884/g.9189 Transcript_3884/m.9189 type:complete len:262 (-) Transcript_3884:17-802(-)
MVTAWGDRWRWGRWKWMPAVDGGLRAVVVVAATAAAVGGLSSGEERSGTMVVRRRRWLVARRALTDLQILASVCVDPVACGLLHAGARPMHAGAREAIQRTMWTHQTAAVWIPSQRRTTRRYQRWGPREHPKVWRTWSGMWRGMGTCDGRCDSRQGWRLASSRTRRAGRSDLLQARHHLREKEFPSPVPRAVTVPTHGRGEQLPPPPFQRHGGAPPSLPPRPDVDDRGRDDARVSTAAAAPPPLAAASPAVASPATSPAPP